MKRLLRAIFLALLLTGLVPSILLAVDKSAGNVYEDTYYGQLPAMANKAYQAEGKKLLVIGTSSVAFGLDSALLEDLLQEVSCDYTVCSFGLYGAIGTKAMLELSKDCLQGGDVVILAPEPYPQAMSLYFSGEHLWYAIESDRALLSHLPANHLRTMVGRYASFVSSKFPYFKEGRKAGPSGVYAKASFDENGDMKNAAKATNQMADGFDPNNPIVLGPALFGEGFYDYLNAYIKEMKQKGVTVWFSYAPINREALVTDSPEELMGYDHLIREALSCPVISNPNDYVLDAGWFFDSNFHLNESGMELRTLQLFDVIKNELGITARTTREYPAMPAPGENEQGQNPAGQGQGQDNPAGNGQGQTPAGQGQWQGQTPGTPGGQQTPGQPQGPTQPQTPGQPEDSMNADQQAERFFIFAEKNNEMRITGLTDEGAAQEKLSIPARYQGKNVTGFDASVFAGNTSLTELTLPDTIRILRDGSFEGCENLARVILTQPDPARIQVGYELFKGCERSALVVPKGTLDAYVNNYFWGFYADRMEEEKKGGPIILSRACKFSHMTAA